MLHHIENVNALTAQGWIFAEHVVLQDGKIASIASDFTLVEQPNPTARYLLPGIIDAHGDAFERHIAPRTTSTFPLNLALAANDADLISAGITTFYLSITDGFEPGIRSRQTVRQLIDTIEALRPELHCDTRIHIRHEQANTEDHGELISWLAEHRIDLLSLNNHVPPEGDDKRVQCFSDSLNRRLNMSDEQINQFIRQLHQQLPLGLEQSAELADVAQKQGIPLASHDDKDADDVAAAIARGVAIAEFPMTLDVATQLKAAGIAVLVGAPNLVRGGSHIGALGAGEAIQAQQVDMLCSDYYYPALFNAPFIAAQQGLCDFIQAWKLVSEAPAQALGIGNITGKIDIGFDGDLLLLNSLSGSPLAIEQVWVKGQLALNRRKLELAQMDG
ncbi:alpha-D-ribose 1-methylphosphonate 5-triphosphate diphosphatase [Salinibius halmophilus]|uniref:alpha-D-ribose 1-methylphosphonate 5-triphosphate diphosphatase n=1 Tax=Salinibius halmophilus TaxID=1853216 RepID=UPI000E65FA37|nr:alpha-D-ribose 1-methylphosphonate 5-triphosphate diphosphatase [Salinibius halmophilus]